MVIYRYNNNQALIVNLRKEFNSLYLLRVLLKTWLETPCMEFIYIYKINNNEKRK